MLDTIVALSILFAVSTGQEISLYGSVLTLEGAPAKGVQVGPVWYFEGEPFPVNGAITDVLGHYQLAVETSGRVALLALDVSAGLAALKCVDENDTDVELVLSPARRVFGRISSTELGETIYAASAYAYASCGDDLVPLAQCVTELGEFSFFLPEGEYMLFMHGTDVIGQTEMILVGSEDVDCGIIDLPATNLAKLYGHPAPDLTISEARGIEAGLSLSNLRGKYILIEFWGHW